LPGRSPCRPGRIGLAAAFEAGTLDALSTYIVQRTIDLGSGITVELCVTPATALLWAPEHGSKLGLLRSYSDDRAVREAHDMLRTGRLSPGRWRVTWTATAVAIESLSDGKG
jgi:hypothetical protein